MSTANSLRDLILDKIKEDMENFIDPYLARLNEQELDEICDDEEYSVKRKKNGVLHLTFGKGGFAITVSVKRLEK